MGITHSTFYLRTLPLGFTCLTHDLHMTHCSIPFLHACLLDWATIDMFCLPGHATLPFPWLVAMITMPIVSNIPIWYATYSGTAGQTPRLFTPRRTAWSAGLRKCHLPCVTMYCHPLAASFPVATTYLPTLSTAVHTATGDLVISFCTRAGWAGLCLVTTGRRWHCHLRRRHSSSRVPLPPPSFCCCWIPVRHRLDGVFRLPSPRATQVPTDAGGTLSPACLPLPPPTDFYCSPIPDLIPAIPHRHLPLIAMYSFHKLRYTMTCGRCNRVTAC